MFSFVGDTVLDPFVGSGSTTLAAMECGRNSLGYEIDVGYLQRCKRRILDSRRLFDNVKVVVDE
jgi:site-specific DNA-methyltransferase (adenine-specific)